MADQEIVLVKGGVGLGFTIKGGTDMSGAKDSGIYVAFIKPHGAADKDGRLQVGDQILMVDGNDLTQVTHHQAVQYFHSTGETVTLRVSKPQDGSAPPSSNKTVIICAVTVLVIVMPVVIGLIATKMLEEPPNAKQL